MTGYILVFAIGSLMYGKLADLFPIKSLLTIGIILFALGATLRLFSPNNSVLLSARIVQAMGGATIPASAFIIPARFMPNDRAKVFGIVSATVAFASGLAPITRGLLGGAFNWRYLIILSILSLIAIPFLRKWLPDEQRKKRNRRILVAISIAVAITGLLIFITLFNFIGLIIGIIALIFFIWRVKTFHSPFIEPSLLKTQHYTITILTSFLGTSTMF